MDQPRRPRARRALRLTLRWLVVAGLAFTALMGLAHTKAGRPLLVRMMPLMKLAGLVGARCPLGYDVAMTPQQKEDARAWFAVDHRGSLVAAERPALGFALDHTTSADVLAWAKERGVQCIRPKTGYDLDCSNVPAAALPGGAGAAGGDVASVPLSSLWLTFGEGDRLISLIAMRRDPAVGPIATTFGAVNDELARLGSPAAATSGEPTSAYLSLGLLRQASAEYRFQNYYVMTRAMNLGHGYVMSEEYRSL
jgi:hypothetical protein